MAIEIVDFPIKNGGSFHCYVNVHQRVAHSMVDCQLARTGSPNSDVYTDEQTSSGKVLLANLILELYSTLRKTTILIQHAGNSSIYESGF